MSVTPMSSLAAKTPVKRIEGKQHGQEEALLRAEQWQGRQHRTVRSGVGTL